MTRKFYNAKSSLPDENSTYYRDQQGEKRNKTTPITRNDEDLPNQNHADSSDFRR
jgi:hypothetical protein